MYGDLASTMTVLSFPYLAYAPQAHTAWRPRYSPGGATAVCGFVDRMLLRRFGVRVTSR
jgi:hypothetical protein